VRVRLEGQDHFINRLGRWDDPIAVAKAQAISAEIWRDYREGTLDWSLCRYKPLVEGKDPELLKAMEDLMLRKRQGRTTHAYRVLKRYGGALRTEGEVREFLRWMEAEGLAASTRSTILSTIMNNTFWQVTLLHPDYCSDPQTFAITIDEERTLS